MAMNDQEEYVKAFRGEDDGENQVAESAPEGEAETPAVAVVIDADNAVDQAAEEAGLTAENAQSDVSAEGEAMAEGEVAPEGGDSTGQIDMLEEGEAVGEPVTDEGEAAMSPEDIQRQKSWEGRLRKREEELAAREAAIQSQPAPIDDAEVAEIKQRLAEDFGDEFVAMIEKLAANEAKKLAASGIDEKIGGISSTIEQIINDTKQAFSAMHYGAIADAHEDFLEIAESEQFQQWLASMPEEKRAAAENIVQAGRPGQVIKLLTEYKEHCKQKESGANEDTELALDAASGVRSSSPVKLPDRVPANPDDEYRAAWNQM